MTQWLKISINSSIFQGTYSNYKQQVIIQIFSKRCCAIIDEYDNNKAKKIKNDSFLRIFYKINKQNHRVQINVFYSEANTD